MDEKLCSTNVFYVGFEHKFKTIGLYIFYELLGLIFEENYSKFWTSHNDDSKSLIKYSDKK